MMKSFVGNSCNTVLYRLVKMSTMIVDFTDLQFIICYRFYKVLVNSILLHTQFTQYQIPFNVRNDLRHNVPNYLGHISTQCKQHTIKGCIVSLKLPVHGLVQYLFCKRIFAAYCVTNVFFLLSFFSVLKHFGLNLCNQ